MEDDDQVHPMSWLDYSRRNPQRALDWRWRLAGISEILKDCPARVFVDEWARRAAEFRGQVMRNSREKDPESSREDRTIAAAFRLRASRQKDEVGLRLLAGQSDATIAARCGLDPDIVAAYAALFYDVRPLFGHSDALLFAAVGSRLYDADGGGIDTTLKLLAIHGGPFVVDHLLGGPGEVSTTGRQLPEIVRILTRVRALDAEGPDGKLILRLFARMVVVDREDARVQIEDVAVAMSRDLAAEPSQLWEEVRARLGRHPACSSNSDVNVAKDTGLRSAVC